MTVAYALGPEFNYPAHNPRHDDQVYLEAAINTEHQILFVDAATTAGRPQPDSIPKPNEDAFGIIRRGNTVTAAIFDGASSQKPIPELKGVTGARYASHILKQLFEAMEDDDIAADTMLSQLNGALGIRVQTFPSVNFDDRNSLPTSTATIVQLDADKDRLNGAHVGDSFAAALMQDGSTELLTNDLHRPFDDQVLELIKNISREQGTTPREARSDPRVNQAIRHMFQDTRNRPDGTGEGMVNGDPHMDQYIHRFSLRLSEVQAVLVGSDGLVPPDMDERQPADLMKLFCKVGRVGIAGIIKRTRQVEDADPDRYHVRFKHADDATGILLRPRSK